MTSEPVTLTAPSLSTSEGPLQTSRLTVHHLLTHPPDRELPRALFLGGSNFDLRLKRAFLSAPFATRCNLATYEPRGIGRTERPDGAWSMHDYSQDALAVMDALDWPDAHILGESFGGMTGLHVAIAAPDRVLSLTVSSATAGGPEHSSFDIAQFLALPHEEAADKALCLLDSRNADLRITDPDAFAKALQQRLTFEQQFSDPSIKSGGYTRLLDARAGHDCTAALDRLTVPTTVIAGKYDLQARPAAQQALAQSLPNARFHLFDAGHGVLFSDTDATLCAFEAIQRAATL